MCRRALADDRRGEPDAVAWPRGRDVLDSPGLLERCGDRRVDACEVRRRSRTVVLASGCARELLECVGVEPLAFDPDRVDRRVRLACRLDRGRERAVARVVGPVAEDDDHATRQRVSSELVRRGDHGVVERGALRVIGCHASERQVRVALDGRERRECRDLRAEGDDRELVGCLLGSYERARTGRGVCQRLATHRLRTVDERRDCLDAPEVLRLKADDGGAVLPESRPAVARRRVDRRADGRIGGCVHTAQLDSRTCGGRNCEEDEREPGDGEPESAH